MLTRFRITFRISFSACSKLLFFSTEKMRTACSGVSDHEPVSPPSASNDAGDPWITISTVRASVSGAAASAISFPVFASAAAGPRLIP
eukprot:3271266-Rhodomonas_salina.1